MKNFELEKDSMLLISMPWQNLGFPSIQLAVLKCHLVKKINNIKVDLMHAYLKWAEYLANCSDKYPVDELINTIENIVMESSYLGIGEWIFTNALYEDNYKYDEYIDYLKVSLKNNSDADILNQDKDFINKVIWFYEKSSQFIDKLSLDIISKKYKIIAFTDTLSQNISSLALAKKIKIINPNVIIIFGGANCDGIQGEALLRNYNFIDYILSGEGEESFPQLIDSILKNNIDDVEISGLIYRDKQNTIRKNPEKIVDVNKVMFPKYDNYFTEINNLSIGKYVKNKILIESSKGCWWGNSFHCLFCGLNDKYIKFRSKKSSEVYLAMLDYMKRYSCGDFYFVDNIMDEKYYKTLLSKLSRLDYDISIFYEIKSNINKRKAEILFNAGVTVVQPGIESLSTNLLKKMNKGIKAIQNVQTLKLCKQYSIKVAWNMLLGFPDETEQDYTLDYWERLEHLEPPHFSIRIYLERFSPYFVNQNQLINLGPDKYYKYLYDLNDKDIADMSYLFTYKPLGVSNKFQEKINNFVKRWNLNHATSFLYYKVRNNEIEIFDSRSCKVNTSYFISQQDYVIAFLYMDEIKTIDNIFEHIHKKLPNSILTKKDIYIWCEKMCAMKYFYKEDNLYISLVIPFSRFN